MEKYTRKVHFDRIIAIGSSHPLFALVFVVKSARLDRLSIAPICCQQGQSGNVKLTSGWNCEIRA